MLFTDNYMYDAGISRPLREPGIPHDFRRFPINPLYSDFLRILSTKVQAKKQALEDRKQHRANQQNVPPSSFFSTEHTGPLEGVLKHKHACCNERLGCYLCNTATQAERTKTDYWRDKVKTPKPRVKYVAPPPTVLMRPPERPVIKDALYKFIVVTGKDSHAGTSANVYVNLEDVHQRRLGKQQLRKKNFFFGSGSKETFFVKGPLLSDIRRLAIEHDGTTEKSSWFLKMVTVVPLNGEMDKYIFTCNKWIKYNRKEDSAKIYLEPEIVPMYEQNYVLKIKTGVSPTTGSVYVTLFGTNGVSKRILLEHPSRDQFQADKWDTFDVVMDADVGNISKICVEHCDSKGDGSKWLLEEIVIEDIQGEQNYKFPCGQWFSKDSKQSALEFYPVIDGKQNRKEKRNTIKYEVAVTTGRKKFAGTDAHVFITIYGEGAARTTEKELMPQNKKIDPFEAGQTDEFMFTAEDVGEIREILIWHDNSGAGPGWYLCTVVIKRYFSQLEVSKRIQMDEYSQRGSMRSLRKTAQQDGDEEDFLLSKSDRSNKKRPSTSYSRKNAGNIMVAGEDHKQNSKNRPSSAAYRQRDDDSLSISSRDSDIDRKRTTSSRQMSSSSFSKGYEQHSLKQITEELSDESYSDEKNKYRRDQRTRKQHGSSSAHRQQHRSDSSESETDSGSDSSDSTYIPLALRRKKAASQNDAQRDKRGAYQRESPEESGEEDDGRATLLKRSASTESAGRIPHYEEYAFDCNKWLAKDEGDGQIERRLKPKSVTTVYRV